MTSPLNYTWVLIAGVQRVKFHAVCSTDGEKADGMRPCGEEVIVDIWRWFVGSEILVQTLPTATGFPWDGRKSGEFESDGLTDFSVHFILSSMKAPLSDATFGQFSIKFGITQCV